MLSSSLSSCSQLGVTLSKSTEEVSVEISVWPEGIKGITF